MHEPPHTMTVRTLVRDVLEAAITASVLFVVLRLVVQNTIVDGPSMEPSLVDGQWLLVNKIAYRFGPPARGDVIVFDAPDGSHKEFIKRVIALPGETVALRGGRVTIDGEPLSEAWLPRFDDSAFGPYTVPRDAYFVLGDNRPRSNDSRNWQGDASALRTDAIIGQAWLSVWPLSRWGVVGSDGPGPGS